MAFGCCNAGSWHKEVNCVESVVVLDEQCMSVHEGLWQGMQLSTMSGNSRYSMGFGSGNWSWHRRKLG